MTTPLQRGEVQGYDMDRMVVEFTMLDEGKVVRCAITVSYTHLTLPTILRV